MRFDDGFAAFLNGHLIASSNAPASLAWNSTATQRHLDTQAVQWTVFDVSAARQWPTQVTLASPIRCNRLTALGMEMSRFGCCSPSRRLVSNSSIRPLLVFCICPCSEPKIFFQSSFHGASPDFHHTCALFKRAKPGAPCPASETWDFSISFCLILSSSFRSVLLSVSIGVTVFPEFPANPHVKTLVAPISLLPAP